MKLTHLAQLVSLISTSRAVSLPNFGAVLDPRATNKNTKTNVTIATTKIGWGNVQPGTVFRKAINAVCTNALEGCDEEDTGPLTVATSLYQANGQTIVPANIVFQPSGSASGDISNFVECIADAIDKFTTCAQEKVIEILGSPTVEGQVRPHLQI